MNIRKLISAVCVCAIGGGAAVFAAEQKLDENEIDVVEIQGTGGSPAKADGGGLSDELRYFYDLSDEQTAKLKSLREQCAKDLSANALMGQDAEQKREAERKIYRDYWERARAVLAPEPAEKQVQETEEPFQKTSGGACVGMSAQAADASAAKQESRDESDLVAAAILANVIPAAKAAGGVFPDGFRERLNLNGEQVEKIKWLWERCAEQTRVVEKRIYEDYRRKMLAVFTPEQRAKYEKERAERIQKISEEMREKQPAGAGGQTNEMFSSERLQNIADEVRARRVAGMAAAPDAESKFRGGSYVVTSAKPASVGSDAKADPAVFPDGFQKYYGLSEEQMEKIKPFRDQRDRDLSENKLTEQSAAQKWVAVGKINRDFWEKTLGVFTPEQREQREKYEKERKERIQKILGEMRERREARAAAQQAHSNNDIIALAVLAGVIPAAKAEGVVFPDGFREHLNLNDEQAAKIGWLWEQHAEQKQIVEKRIHRDYWEKALGVLTPEQREKFAGLLQGIADVLRGRSATGTEDRKDESSAERLQRRADEIRAKRDARQTTTPADWERLQTIADEVRARRAERQEQLGAAGRTQLEKTEAPAAAE